MAAIDSLDQETSQNNSPKSFASYLQLAFKFNLGLILIICFAFFVRVYHLSEPQEMYFDEVYHGYTAEKYLNNEAKSYEFWTPPPDKGFAYEWVHPPLAKLIMAGFMGVCGKNSFGRRIGSAIFGTGIVLIIYFLTLELAFSRKTALLASWLASIEGLLITQSRIAMNDSYFVCFLLLAFLFYIKWRKRSAYANPQIKKANKSLLNYKKIHNKLLHLGGFILSIKLFKSASRYSDKLTTGKSANKILAPHCKGVGGYSNDTNASISPSTNESQKQNAWNEYKYLLISGLFFGLAISCKWSALFFLLILGADLLVLTFQYGFAKKSLYILFFILLPLLIYIVSYMPFFTTSHSFTQFIDTQKQIWMYHTGLKATHPYQSKPWQWIFNLRPVWMYTKHLTSGHSVNIFNWANSIILIGGFVSILHLLISILKSFDWRKYLIVISYFAMFAPWINSPSIMFFYHYLPSLPFLIIGLAVSMQEIFKKKMPIPAYAILISAFGFFLIACPLNVGLHIPETLNKDFYKGLTDYLLKQ